MHCIAKNSCGRRATYLTAAAWATYRAWFRADIWVQRFETVQDLLPALTLRCQQQQQQQPDPKIAAMLAASNIGADKATAMHQVWPRPSLHLT